LSKNNIFNLILRVKKTEFKIDKKMILPPKEAIILLVEDNPADQQLTLRAFRQGKLNAKLFIANDGQEAMDYLFNKNLFSEKENFPRPDLILLDINMPRKDGKEVLKEIRANPDLKIIPVIMLTTSDQEKDIIDSYNLGVNAYISKPVRIVDFVNVVCKLEEFWFVLNQLPPRKIVYQS
jgi:two-component system, chemotaxis family, response regulator Rcp1